MAPERTAKAISTAKAYRQEKARAMGGRLAAITAPVAGGPARLKPIPSTRTRAGSHSMIIFVPEGWPKLPTRPRRRAPAKRAGTLRAWENKRRPAARTRRLTGATLRMLYRSRNHLRRSVEAPPTVMAEVRSPTPVRERPGSAWTKR